MSRQLLSRQQLQRWTYRTMSVLRLPMDPARSIALSTASFASGPFGKTLQRFMIPLYSPMAIADLKQARLSFHASLNWMLGNT